MTIEQAAQEYGEEAQRNHLKKNFANMMKSQH